MKCPRCGLIVADQVPQCRGCGFSIGDLDRRLGRPPDRVGRVNDFGGRLSPEERQRLEDRLAQFQPEGGGEIVVATLESTRPVKPSEYVFWLFNRWQIGGDTQAGVLLLLAWRERRIESEIGNAWEALVTEEESDVLLGEHVVPWLQEGRIGEALWQGVDHLARQIESGPLASGEKESASEESEGGTP